ncbi:hypothetical protein GCM10010169_02090 [Micromonospora fulviviridis]|uniref:hypothetical protein n=1 Tax=Micromonospora fulviviridis TaxID=47860 RepID=UPI0016696E54|nr:hypothetical protein [Micromonospora fulviviridis]GGR63130.1 hypothetical protein GCM10010169_02090 [Micromonospora fulviviridis]
MSPFLAVVLVLVLGSTCYAAGRLHGQLSYRIGYRFGYRQGYFDGDRGAWNRRRRDAQAAITSALAGPAPAVVTAPAGRTTPFAGTAVPAAVTARASSGPALRATATAQFGGLATRQGTTYTGSSFGAAGGGPRTGTLVRRQG